MVGSIGRHFVEETIHRGKQKTVYISGFVSGKAEKIPEKWRCFPPGNPSCETGQKEKMKIKCKVFSVMWKNL